MLGADTSYWPDSRKNNENSTSRVSNGLFYTYLPVVGHKPNYIRGHESLVSEGVQKVTLVG